MALSFLAVESLCSVYGFYQTVLIGVAQWVEHQALVRRATCSMENLTVTGSNPVYATSWLVTNELDVIRPPRSWRATLVWFDRPMSDE